MRYSLFTGPFLVVASIATATAAPLTVVPSPGTTLYTSAAAFAAATTGATTIGFNGIIVPPATFANFTSLTVGGATFSNGDPGVDLNVTAASYYAPSFSYASDFLIDASSADPTNTLKVTFGGTHALAFDFGTLFSSAPALITLSDGTVASDPAAANQGGTEFVGFVSSDLVTSLTLTITGESYVLEDLILATPVGVPEPASLALLGVGVVSLGFRRRYTTG